MLQKIIDIVQSILSLFKQQSPKPTPPSQNTQPPSQNKPEQPKPQPVVDEFTAEPEVSSPTGTITSFLYKPVSDTNPKIATFSVSSDTLRAADVRISILDKNQKPVKLTTNKFNVGGTLRNNKLPGHKFGRFNFKPGPTAEQLDKLAPLTVSFTLELNGKSTPIKVMGKDSIKLKNGKDRLDLK